MKLFIDTNLLVAVATKEPERSEDAKAVLNSSHDLYTSVLNLMEVRSVLSKKKKFERDRIEAIEDRISNQATVVFLDASDIVTANQRQRETYLYPMDALIFAAVDSVNATLVSFDRELIENGAKPPQEIL